MNAHRALSSRILGGLLLAGSVVALTGCSLLESVISGVPAGEADVFTLSVGDCLDDLASSDEVSSVPIVDCAEPHDSEVFARTDTTSATFPGNEALFGELTEFCHGDAFTEFVGIPYVDSAYGTSGYVPTQGSWDAQGDRELLCTIGDPNGKTTGSLAGIGQ